MLMTHSSVDAKARATPDYSYSKDPAALGKAIRTRGAHDVVHELFVADDPWVEILKNIHAGSSRWLDTALLLWRGSDAHASEDLEYAIGAALGENPEYVLRHMIPTFSLEAVCGGPSVDDVESYRGAISLVERSEVSVRRVNARGLRRRRDECLKYLNEARGHLKKFYGIE